MRGHPIFKGPYLRFDGVYISLIKFLSLMIRQGPRNWRRRFSGMLALRENVEGSLLLDVLVVKVEDLFSSELLASLVEADFNCTDGTVFGPFLL